MMRRTPVKYQLKKLHKSFRVIFYPSAKLIRMFIGQFSKGNSMGPIKIHNGGNYTHAQDSNIYNLCQS